jgi:hypothetical protein
LRQWELWYWGELRYWGELARIVRVHRRRLRNSGGGGGGGGGCLIALGCGCNGSVGGTTAFIILGGALRVL